MDKEEKKYQFDHEFQQSILQYTVTDKNGHKALSLYEDHYFDLLEHQVIAHALKEFFHHKKAIPKSRFMLKEYLRKMFLSKDFVNELSAQDKERISKIVIKIYKGPVKDGDGILDEVIKFSQFIQLKEVVENVNLTDFSQYDRFSDKVRKAITIGSEFRKGKGTFLIRNIKERQYKRRFHEEVIPTPFNGINILTNAGGYAKGTVICIMGPEKEFKTGMLINVARGLMRIRRKVLYIDLENGQDNIAVRLEQSVMNKGKFEILKGEYDEKVLKQLRKYRRLGAEIDIKRLPAYSTTCNHIQSYMDEQYSEYGIRFTDLIVDYAGMLGAISGAKDEFNRISEAYVDLKNLAEYNQLNTTWTANHVIREAEKRFKSKFVSTDIAKCIDIPRHVDVLFGFNRSDFDVELGTARLEIIDQRDGEQRGNTVFMVDYKTQRATELTPGKLKDYRAQLQLRGEGDGEKPIYKGDL